MSILVTGGAGYIGSQTVLECLDAGEQVVVVDDLSTGFRSAVAETVPLVIGDVGDQELVTKVIAEHRIREVIHFAGSTVVPDSVRDPLSYYRNNTVKSRDLIEASLRAGVQRLVFSSSAAVYGNPVRVPVQEDDPTAPISPYGWTKLMTEVMLRDTSAVSALSHVALRYFNVAGADDRLRAGQSTAGATHLIKVAVEAAVGTRTGIEVFGTDYPTRDGSCIRDYVHVRDVARAHLAALEYLRAGGVSTTLNCGYGHGYSVLEVLAAVQRIAGIDLELAFGPRRQGDAAEVVAQTAGIRRILNWRPQFDDLDKIVSNALAWERHITELRQT